MRAGEVVCDRPARRRALGRAPAEDGDDVAPEPRLAAAQAARADVARHAAAGLRAPGRARAARPRPLRAARRRGAQRADAERAAKLLREALALWRGPPLADLAFETFAQSEIRRLEELRLEALEERIDADLELGLGRELVAELEALVERTRCASGFAAQLMLALYRSGRQAEALEVYHDARRALVDELGIDPGPALQQLYARSCGRRSCSSRAPAPRRVEDHYADVVEALLAGRLVPVLGTGVERAAPADGRCRPDEVAAYLAERFDYPPEHERDLARVSEYVA